MDFRFTDEQDEMRREIRAFLTRRLGDDWVGIDPDAYFTDENWPLVSGLTLELAEKGWLTLGWPEEYGGLGGSHVDRMIYSEETAYFRAPTRASLIGVDLVGPTLMLYGTEEQKSRFLPEIADGSAVYCQGFSEPGSGSDLASLELRAEKDGDDYVLNGTKIWTSGAHRSNRCYLMARTDPSARKHRGISVFIADMDTPGIEVRPILNTYGLEYFNQVFFEDARVPAENMIGDRDRGWYAAAASLDFERSGIAQFAWNRRSLEEIGRVAREERIGGRRPWDDAMIRRRAAELWTANEAGRMVAYKVGWMQSRGMVPNMEASVSKLMGSETAQGIAELGMKAAGGYGLLDRGSRRALLDGRPGREWMDSVSFTIRAGTSEIQRNVIATRGLGLPRG